jgi:hypothetical protein
MRHQANAIGIPVVQCDEDSTRVWPTEPALKYTDKSGPCCLEFGGKDAQMAIGTDNPPLHPVRPYSYGCSLLRRGQAHQHLGPTSGMPASMQHATARVVQLRTSTTAASTQHDHRSLRGNRTSTTKYNLLTFLPKALFEQFRCATGRWAGTVRASSCCSTALALQQCTLHNRPRMRSEAPTLGRGTSCARMPMLHHDSRCAVRTQLHAVEACETPICVPARAAVRRADARVAVHARRGCICLGIRVHVWVVRCRRLANIFFALMVALSLTPFSPVR